MGKASRNKQNRTKQPQPVYYHGGRGGLNVGDVLQPGRKFADSKFLADSIRDDYKVAGHSDFVHITTDLDLAVAYAWTATLQDSTLRDKIPADKMPGDKTPGAVYRVTPVGKISMDPDYSHAPGVGVRCPRAEITEVIRAEVPLSEKSSQAGAKKYETYDDGYRMYTEDGHARPTRNMRFLGFTETHYHELGLWPSLQQINTRATVLVGQKYPGLDDDELQQIVERNTAIIPDDVTF